MTSAFHLTIASVGETRFDGAALSATIPTSAGEITVLPNHEPLVATLKKGAVTVRREAGEPQAFGIEGGVLEVARNRVTVLL